MCNGGRDRRLFFHPTSAHDSSLTSRDSDCAVPLLGSIRVLRLLALAPTEHRKCTLGPLPNRALGGLGWTEVLLLYAEDLSGEARELRCESDRHIVSEVSGMTHDQAHAYSNEIAQRLKAINRASGRCTRKRAICNWTKGHSDI